MAGSTVVAARAGIVSLLQADPDLTGVQVSYGFPGGDRVEGETVYLGRAVGETSHPTMRGPGQRIERQESYTFDVVVEVVKDGTQEDADTRAWFIARQVEEALADTPRLGTTTVKYAVMEEWEMDVLTTDTGSGSRIRMGVRCLARLL